MKELSSINRRCRPESFFGPWKSIALLFFADYESAAEDAMQRGDEFPKVAVGMMHGFEAVFRAVPLFIMARSGSSQRAKYKKAAMKLLERVRGWVKKGCINLVGPHQLIAAEYMASKKNVKSAKYNFEMAISTCRKDNFHHFAGLSCKLYADYLSEIGDSKGSQIYLQGAIDNYRCWGAERKVSFLKHRLD